MTNDERRELRAIYRVGETAREAVCIFGGAGPENRRATLIALCKADSTWMVERIQPPSPFLVRK